MEFLNEFFLQFATIAWGQPTQLLLTADVRVAAQEEDPQRDGPAGAGRAEAIQRLQAHGGDSGHGYGALEQDRRGRVRHARGLFACIGALWRCWSWGLLV